jgi:glutamate synthase domain-containing protein 2
VLTIRVLISFLAETIRPEIRQYFVESDTESVPFSRLERSIVYQRAKGVPDTLSFGTRQDVHAVGYEWCRHSMQPHHVPAEAARVAIGGPAVAPQHVYSSSLLNVSGMSYGALSDNAILALNTAARLGVFSHNTGEGGISRFHLAPGGDIVWNIGRCAIPAAARVMGTCFIA